MGECLFSVESYLPCYLGRDVHNRFAHAVVRGRNRDRLTAPSQHFFRRTYCLVRSSSAWTAAGDINDQPLQTGQTFKDVWRVESVV
jgi:hypothetical protein